MPLIRRFFHTRKAIGTYHEDVLYTTNAIESLNSGYRRLNKQRSVFPSDTALLKVLYLATHEIAKKWTMPLRNWGIVLGELEIMYLDRLS